MVTDFDKRMILPGHITLNQATIRVQAAPLGSADAGCRFRSQQQKPPLTRGISQPCYRLYRSGTSSITCPSSDTLWHTTLADRRWSQSESESDPSLQANDLRLSRTRSRCAAYVCLQTLRQDAPHITIELYLHDFLLFVSSSSTSATYLSVSSWTPRGDLQLVFGNVLVLLRFLRSRLCLS